MCLIVFSYQQHPQYDLILAANRDEQYERPTRPAQFWDDHPQILAGKDLEAGGTWMGINKNGRISALTNFRNPAIRKPNPPSRGHLVLDFLKNNGDPESYLQTVDKKADQYMGFNLLAGTLGKLTYYSNQRDNIEVLRPGLYGLSNHLLDTPWPKVQSAKSGLAKIIEDEAISADALLGLLADDREAPDDKLPSTGLPPEIEKKVSPIFIKSDGYGTRCSTALLIDKNGEAMFIERRFNPGTMDVEDENRYQFSINNS